MRMSWAKVKDADCYLVRKYTDKTMTEVESETYVDKTKFTDASFDNTKANFYSVTAVVQTIAGNVLNGETPVIVKMDNPMTVSGKIVEVAAATLKQDAVSLEVSEVLDIENAHGEVTYKKSSGNKKITVDQTTGGVNIKKGLKKGTYKVKVKVKAAGNDEYNAATKTVTFKIKVTK